MEFAMRRLVRLYRNDLLIALIAMPLLTLTACSEAMVAELQQDESAYHNSIARLAADQAAGDAAATAADEHQVKLASTKLRYDRGIITGPNEHEHQEKQGHTKP
jgi:hypothetical protein